MAVKNTIERTIRNTWLFPIEANSSEAEDYTDYKVYFTVSNHLGPNKTILFTRSGFLDVDGKITFTVDADENEDFEPGTYMYDFTAINALGQPSSTEVGELIVSDKVTPEIT